ncbi:hypothetical protein, partial [Rhizorhabdus sp.]|uniref:hypothetical protein n=1 Tax=Rhizorhabdus sp. TaxID=1968843 RepID=UPI0035ADC8D9
TALFGERAPGQLRYRQTYTTTRDATNTGDFVGKNAHFNYNFSPNIIRRNNKNIATDIPTILVRIQFA